MQWMIEWINEWMINQHQPQARHHCFVFWEQLSWEIGASVLTLVGKGCKTTPSSCRVDSTRWGYCFGVEPVSYMDMALPPRLGCRLKGPWRCCCPLGVCHRSVEFSLCRELSCGEQNIFQFSPDCGTISTQIMDSMIGYQTVKPATEKQLVCVDFTSAFFSQQRVHLFGIWNADIVFLNSNSCLSDPLRKCHTSGYPYLQKQYVYTETNDD